MAKERLDEQRNTKLSRFLESGDPKDEVITAWYAKESLRERYCSRDPELAKDHLDALIGDFTDKKPPQEVNLAGKTLRSWHDEILSWHRAFVTNGPVGVVEQPHKARHVHCSVNDQLCYLSHQSPPGCSQPRLVTPLKRATSNSYAQSSSRVGEPSRTIEDP